MGKYSVRVPDDLAAKLEAAADQKHETVSAVAAEAVMAYAKRRKSVAIAPSK